MITECRVCGSRSLDSVLDLGDQPWANDFLKADEVGTEKLYPLQLLVCNQCSLSQLSYTVAKETMFSSHTYLSGMTKTLTDHFDTTAKKVVSKFFPHDDPKTISVLDIGSNDGSQLKSYQEMGCEVLGVESSSNIAAIAIGDGVPTVANYFNLDLVNDLNRTFNVINASGVFFHLEEIHSVTQGIKAALDKDGVFVVQCLYMGSIMNNVAFDQIYHEHLFYYTVKTLNYLLNLHGLELFDCEECPIHGGSIIGYASHKGRFNRTSMLETLENKEASAKTNLIKTYFDFADKATALKHKNRVFIQDALNAGKKIYGLGAPVKGNTLLNYFGFTTKEIEALTEINPLREGLFAPGSHIPILMENTLDTHPDLYYVLAWNFKDEILSKNHRLISAGVQFYFPIET